MAATQRQQEDDARSRLLARETAHRTAFKPHLRVETERVIPQPIFVAALIGTARLRFVELPGEAWHVSHDERDRLVRQAVRDHYREHGGWVPAFGAIVGYTAVMVPGYRIDFGFPYDLNGNPTGPMRPVERLGEATLGMKRGDTRLTGLLKNATIREVPIGHDDDRSR
jgi:hypothetical protein